MPKISIIIAVYNVKLEYLKKCLNSVLNQTLTDIEIIIIDDGSVLKCARVCDEYAEKDKRIKVIHKKNEGVSIASNLGISMASGEYLTFVDDDDWVAPEMCEKAYNKIKQYNADAAIWLYQSAVMNKIKKAYYVGPPERVFEKSDINMLQAQILDAFAFYDIRISLAGANWCKLYNTELVKNDLNARFPEGMMGGEDAIFTFKALDKMHKVVLFEDYLYYYRQNMQSYTKQFKPDRLKDELRMFRYFKKLIYNKSMFDIPYYKSVCHSYIGLCINLLFHEQNKMSLWDKRNYLKKLLNCEEYYTAINKYKECGFSKSKTFFLFLSNHKRIWSVLLLAKLYHIKSKEVRYQ